MQPKIVDTHDMHTINKKQSDGWSHINQNHDLVAVSASDYSVRELVEIYNQTRTDYIVPMPMNEARLQEYIDAYDINLEASLVVCSSDMELLAVSMLGIRGTRAWITRLGVLPGKRRHGTGQFIMAHHLHMSVQYEATQIQLEVIKNNTPAHQLFLKNGFRETRELLIVRRAPGEIDPRLVPAYRHMAALEPGEIGPLLAVRGDAAAWTEETNSLLNAGNLEGAVVELETGSSGYLIFHRTPFQLSHFVFSASAYEDPALVLALLYYVHSEYPEADTKIENVPLDSPIWASYQQAGYIDVFRRIEMVRPL